MKKLLIVLIILAALLSACGGKSVKLEEISVKTPPSKLTYAYGDKLNVSGGKIELAYSDGSVKEIDLTLDMCGITDVYKIGNNIPVTVTYNENDIVKTTAFNINCSAPANYYAGNGFYFYKPASWAVNPVEGTNSVSFNSANVPYLTIHILDSLKYTEQYSDAALKALIEENDTEINANYGDPPLFDSVELQNFVSFETKTNVSGFGYTVVLKKGANAEYYFKLIFEAPGNNIYFTFYTDNLSDETLKNEIFDSIIIVNN